MTSPIGTVIRVVTDFGVLSLTPFQAAVMKDVPLRKDGRFDMRYHAGRAAFEMEQALLRRAHDEFARGVPLDDMLEAH